MIVTTVLECPNCGAPLDDGVNRCTHCSLALVIAPPRDGVTPIATPVRKPESTRVEKLAAYFTRSALNDMWKQAAPAWVKWREEGDDGLDGDEGEACDVLMAVLSVTLLAARGADREQLPAVLTTVSHQALKLDVASHALGECRRVLDEDGFDEAIGAAAELLREVELLEEAYQLASGITLLSGSITRGEGRALDDIAEAFDFGVKSCKKMRQRVARAMA